MSPKTAIRKAAKAATSRPHNHFTSAASAIKYVRGREAPFIILPSADAEKSVDQIALNVGEAVTIINGMKDGAKAAQKKFYAIIDKPGVTVEAAIHSNPDLKPGDHAVLAVLCGVHGTRRLHIEPSSAQAHANATPKADGTRAAPAPTP